MQTQRLKNVYIDDEPEQEAHVWKGKMAYRNVMPSTEEEKRIEIERFMQNIVYKYTKKEL